MFRLLQIKLLFVIISLFTLINQATADTHSDVIAKAVNAENRSTKNVARDNFRHPQETLEFFGIQPDMHVLEILPGGGWYTEILAPLLGENGLLTAASFGANHPNDYLRGVHNKFMRKLDNNPAAYDKIKRIIFEDNGYLSEVVDESQDMVLTFRNTHNWIRYGGIEQAYNAIHRVLKKGGILGVVQHRAAKGTNAKETAEKGYVPETYLIRLLEDTGFELVTKSEINANPKDTKDYPEGVWSLPPSLRLGDVDKDKYMAIGESDRMTLRFIKL